MHDHLPHSGKLRARARLRLRGFICPAHSSPDNFDPLRAQRTRTVNAPGPVLVSWGDLAAHPWLLWE
jgi:hypothetical protein